MTAIISLVILLVAAGVTLVIFLTEPKAQREGATLETAILVDVTTAEYGTFRPELKATGTVRPAQDIILSPRVNGEVMSISENFTPGGFVKKGEVLLQIDPSDYRNDLALRQSELKQALADLNIEEGRQEIARSDYRLVEDSLSEDNKSLVLREPQMEAIRARVDAARASLEQAKLELARTAVRAPFDAHILSRNVNAGSQVAAGENLGHLVGLDEYWVVTTIPMSKLQWISFPDNGEPGSEVLIRNRTAWEANSYRKGYIFKLIGALEDQTRLARVLVRVPDPMAYQDKTGEMPLLIIGTFVEVTIQADQIPGVVRINRDYTRNENTVWLMQGDSLMIREVDIKLQDSRYAYISGGLNEGDKIVTTNLSTVAEGVKLRTETGDSTSVSGEELSEEQ